MKAVIPWIQDWGPDYPMGPTHLGVDPVCPVCTYVEIEPGVGSLR